MYDEDRWGRHLTALGHPVVRPLGAGVEGAVWSLGDGLVAKVWFSRPLEDVVRLGAFLDEVARAGLPFGTPRQLAVATGPDGAVWTLEPELDGRPLAVDTPGRSPDLTPGVVEVLLDVHEALAAVVPSPGLRMLPVLGEAQPLLVGHRHFPDALAALVERRLARTAAVLAAVVPEVAALAGAVTGALRRMEDPQQGLVHGDLFGPNVLVDDRLAPTAVLDFGFLSTVGDPAFDAAVTAGVVDLYGPRAAAHRDLLDEALIDRFAHPAQLLSRYRLAYALVTAAWFDPAGQDGHTRWCRDILRGSDVERAAL